MHIVKLDGRSIKGFINLVNGDRWILLPNGVLRLYTAAGDNVGFDIPADAAGPVITRLAEIAAATDAAKPAGMKAPRA